MDIELARDLVRTAFRVSGELQQLLPVLKQRCPEEEYRSLARGIAQAIDYIGVGLTGRALGSHPELKEEIDAMIAKTGSYR